MIERLDNSCGRIFDKVSELGLDENTIIIFFSDNGGLDREAAQTPLRKGKGWGKFKKEGLTVHTLLFMEQ
jgi:arylsulfatase A